MARKTVLPQLVARQIPQLLRSNTSRIPLPGNDPLMSGNPLSHNASGILGGGSWSQGKANKALSRMPANPFACSFPERLMARQGSQKGPFSFSRIPLGGYQLFPDWMSSTVASILSTGLSPLSLGWETIVSTVSIPSVTSPKAVYCPSR